MEKTDKSAEEILNENASFKRIITKEKYSCTGIPYTDAINAMHEFAAQQLSEYKEVIKELLPLATSSKLTVDDPNWRELWENKKAIIDRAKKLIEK